jgi:DNA-directed RNA polymerase specialized sigma24 family protein
MSRSSDLEIAQRAADGDVPAWHAFVERYSGLIYSLVGRYLGDPDEDERRTVYVAVLESLHGGALARYDGRAALSTWIGVVTRSRCLDRHRSRHGRRQAPQWLAGLAERDQEVYRLYFLEGLSYALVCDRIRGKSPEFSVEDLVDALDRIEGHLDAGMRKRLAFDLQARTSGAASGRVLEYCAEISAETGDEDSVYAPEREVVEKELRARLERLEAAIERLDAEEAHAVASRFERGLTARETADVMGLSSPRRVYTIVDRALRKLREILEVQEA